LLQRSKLKLSSVHLLRQIKQPANSVATAFLLVAPEAK
jgi:hypothetical protein